MRGLLLVFSLHAPGSGPKSAPADPWFGADKLKHFFSSAFVQSVSYGALRGVGAGHDVALGGASAVTAAVAVGKEIYDGRTGGDVSAKDLVWDAAGALAMTTLLNRQGR
jgi:putative lipoprotein